MRIDVQPVKKHCLVLREEVQVIFEYNEIVLGDFGVRRIGVLEIDRAVGQRGVAECVIDSAYIVHLQIVAPAEWRPAVLPVEELMRQAHSQAGMLPQIADFVNAELGGTIPLHYQSVSIIEAKLTSYADALFTKQRTDVACAERFLCL